jgi:hypothetical protein
MIAALFVETNGVYFNIDGIDPWDIKRDATLYSGPYPVIAHPPCQLWGSLAYVNYSRWGGEHNKPGNDGGLFKFALQAVKKFGGVLEHPAKTRAWEAHGLIKPTGIGWSKSDCGWACEVWQSAYGHKANKATWLFYSGNLPPFDLNWDRAVGKYQIGGHDQRGKDKNKPTVTRKEANATPIAFMDELIKLANLSDKR